MKNYNIITLFPNLFSEHQKILPLRRAIDNDDIKINIINLRDFAVDKRGTVDDKTYGGGVGMLLMMEPIYKALKSIYKDDFEIENGNIEFNNNRGKIVLLAPRGEKYTQKKAEEFTEQNEITFICGRYEGVDARIEKIATDVISIGDYVLSGGELPTMVILESIVRLMPGILEKEEASKIESFSDGKIEYPQYTRPENFKGLTVPEILLSGNHENIEKWRINNRN